MGMFRAFFANGKFVCSMNSTFLVLIQKKGGVVSLVGSLYKLLYKVLVNRLKKVISKVISPAQNAFVKGRQILDASLISNEVLDSTLKRKDKGVLCKLDIEKAYDHLNWSFLFSAMDRMGFGKKWIDWIKWCVTSTSFSVLVNGSPIGFFRKLKVAEARGPSFPLFVCARNGDSV